MAYNSKKKANLRATRYTKAQRKEQHINQKAYWEDLQENPEHYHGVKFTDNVTKYYAVYRGMRSGIFTSWYNARKMINSCSGAVYKSFDTEKEAQEWMEMNATRDRENGIHVPGEVQYMLKKLNENKTEKKNEDSLDKKSYQLYSDGSYDKQSKKYSWAYVLLGYDSRVQRFASDAEVASEDNMWQVSGEIQAVIEGLTYAHENGVKRIIVNYDLINLQKWGDDQWRAKKPETQAYKDAIKRFRAEGMTISFNKIKSHSGSEYNEMCDYLAKQALGFKKLDNLRAISADHLQMMQEAMG